jgi:beta-lactamase regulating signal transducer with metallopeptidase domain/ABC-type glycerol-3-phosphate transport system substrate-binding protein
MLEFLLIGAPRVSLIVIVAFGLTLLMRRSAASLRHWVWVVALLSTLVVPLLTLTAPTVKLVILPPSSSPTRFQPPPALQTPQLEAAPVQMERREASITATEISALRTETSSPLSRPLTASTETLAIGVWLLGVVSVLAVNVLNVSRIYQTAQKEALIPHTALYTLVNSLKTQMGIYRPVQVIVARSVPVPMTFGLSRPVVLLPDAQWDETRLRFVILHELSHIARWDALSNVLGLVATAFYWFNPLVWIAAKQLAVESEYACDDLVLQIEPSHTGYAQHLLDIARSIVAPRLSAVSPLIGRSSLAHRIHSILNPRQRREGTGAGRRLLIAGLALIALLPLALRFTPVQAQIENVVLSLRLPAYNSQLVENIIGEFEAANPGVTVNLIEAETSHNVSLDDTEAFYASVAEVVNTADVIHVPTYWLNPKVTLPGYVLDLKPFTDADPDIDDFYSVALESFAWDGGQWALPTSFMLSFLLYKPEAFDAVNVDYPSAEWTLSDLMNAIQVLTVRDENGNIVTYGFEMLGFGHDRALLTSLLQNDLVDRTTFPYQPDWTNPQLQNLFEAYSEILQAGIIGPRWEENFARPDPNVPLRFGYVYEIGQNGYAGAALPGGGGLIQFIEGLAISAGTQHPELAYELIKFLTTREEMLMNWGQVIPARQSLHEGVRVEYPPEVETLLQQTIANGIPLSETYYFDYLIGIPTRLREGVTYTDAVAEIRAVFDTEIATALAQRDKRGTLAVMQPEAEVELVAGAVELKFGFQSHAQPFPNQEEWETFMTEFAANDGQVGAVDFEIVGNPVDYVGRYDCFYQPYSVELLDVSQLVDLKPLMDADPNFDVSDFLPGVVEAVERGERVVGYPLTLTVLGMRYDVDRVGVLENDWTIDQFAQTLATQTSADTPAVETTWMIPTHLLMLIAAYGGMPIDYSSDELRFDFTNEQTVEAVRQVLDLVKANQIGYVPQPNVEGFQNVPYRNSPIETVIMQSSSVFGMFDPELTNTRLVLFPSGSTYTPMSVAVGSVYISAQSAAPESCYRLIAAITERPDLLADGIPVRRSVINDSAMESTRGEGKATFYRSIEARLDSPDTVLIPSALAGVVPVNQGIFFIERMLYEAFDQVVMENVPLETALADAQLTAEAYAECIEGLPPVDYANYQETYRPLVECARSVAPAIGF